MKKILIVDDSAFMRGILKSILSKYKIVEADSGDKALEQVKKEKPDLVLLDIIMPEGENEGLRVLQEVMKTNRGAQVVMITAVGHDAIIKQCTKLGAKDYIVKPFDEEQVIEKVRKVLGE